MNRGAQLKRAGNVGAQVWFDMQHDRYRRDGKAVIACCHFPVRGAPGKMRPVGGGDTDYVGAARVGQKLLPVAFDLKVNRRASFSINPIEFPELVRQVDILLDFWRAGGVGFLALLDPDAAELWMLGREPIEWLRTNLHKYFAYRAKRGGVWHSLDLPGVVRVPEADALTLARTGIRYDWLTTIPALLPPDSAPVS